MFDVWFVVRCALLNVYWLVFVYVRVLTIGWRLMSVDGWLLFVMCCWPIVVCRLLVV